MSRKLVVDYNLSSEFIVPDDVPLLSVEDNKKADEKTPWSWWVKYDTLYYIDDEGEKQEIEADYRACDSDFKRPNNEYFEEDKEDITECPKKSTESEWYCDVWGHENIKLINDGEGGWYCDECDEETDSDSDRVE